MIPRRFAPFVYGIIQAAITAGVATAIATYQALGLGMEFLEHWVFSWVIAWLTMLPFVILMAPLIQRAVLRLTATDNRPRGA